MALHIADLLDAQAARIKELERELQEAGTPHRTERCEEADYDCEALGAAQVQVAALEAKLADEVDAEPVRHGRWETSETYKGYETCSICHDCCVEVDKEWVVAKWKYCPNCGARMGLEGAEKDG